MTFRSSLVGAILGSAVVVMAASVGHDEISPTNYGFTFGLCWALLLYEIHVRFFQIKVEDD